MPSRPPETKEIQLLEGILAALKQSHPPEHCNCREELALVILELREISNKIDKLIPEPGDATDTIVIVFGGNMSTPGTVAVGSTVVASIVPLEADGVTVTPGAVVSAQGFTVDDPTIASFVVNPDGTATFTGVAAGTANVAAQATVTDANGAVATFTTTNTLTVTAVTPPTGLTSSIAINFGSPVSANLKK